MPLQAGDQRLALGFNGQRRGTLSDSAFYLSRLRCKNQEKLRNLLPDVGGITGQHQVGLCGQFGPPISMARLEPCRPTVVHILRKLKHVDSPFS
jgi:hypothetical protein